MFFVKISCARVNPFRGSEDGEEGGGGGGAGGTAGARAAKGKMVSRFMVTELRQKRKLMGHLGAPGREEIYCDKDRAAAVAMGDQDIKTSLKVLLSLSINFCRIYVWPVK